MLVTRFQAAFLAMLLAVQAVAETQPDSESFSPRVQRLIANMSLEEKVAIIRGAREPDADFQGEAGWTRGVPRLGIPSLRFADGPPGVLVRHESTGMPATLCVAATFSRQEAAANGAVIGRDARALGIDVILQPMINIYRDPTFERAYNTLGEDPVLTGTLAAEFVRAAQAAGVMVQAKHFVAYDGADSVVLDGQALREIYAAPFQMVVDAGVASVMCAYSRLNGAYSCENEEALKQILRSDYGFRGFVTSDWGAAHGPEFITRGMDMEQPGTGPNANYVLRKEPDEPQMTKEEIADMVKTMSIGVPEEPYAQVAVTPAVDAPAATTVSKNLGEALARGTVHASDIDRAAGHVLAQLERFGWLDHAPNHQPRQQAIAANAEVNRHTAEAGAVLLKNDGILPLHRRDLGSLALIGPGADQTFAVVTGSEQSYGRAQREVGVRQALRSMFRGANPTYAVADDFTGVPIPASSFARLMRLDSGSADPVPDTHIDYTRRAGQPLPAGSRTSWRGTLIVPASGDYDIDLQLLGATGTMSIDGHVIGKMAWWAGHGEIVFANRDNVVPTTDGLDNLRRLVQLTPGVHSVAVDAQADASGDEVQVRLAWVTPEMKERAFTAAIAAARAARVAVVFAWSRGRPAFGLPGDQDRLISEVAAANPNTVVVLNTGQAVAMPWLKDVRAVLEMWYTGDEGGWAAANLLSGRTSPAGRLPFTWPRKLEDGLANDPAHRERSSAGVDGLTRYSEGIFVGYRWFDRHGIEPLFPFGFGLSYTTFAYSKLAVTRAANGGLDVAVNVHNTGVRASDEVVQLYLGPPEPAPAGVDFAIHALADFARVSVGQGQTRRVRMHVGARLLRSWSNADSAWRTAGGARTVYVGASSRDLRLSRRVLIAPAAG
jgi:beta-glucosidase